MILVIDAHGNILNTIPDRVYQGSNLANELVLVGVIPQSAQVEIRFSLPNGLSFNPQLTTRGVMPFNGIDQYYWSYSVPIELTEYTGNVVFQFFIYNGTQVIATGTGGFTVERGARKPLPSTPAPDIYQQILQELEKVQSSVDGASEIAEEALSVAQQAEKKAEEALVASKPIEPATADKLGGIKVGESLSIMSDGTLSVDITSEQSPIRIALDGKVPKQLDILQKVVALDIDTVEKRQQGSLYIDVNGTPKYITLEQVKDLNTKILNVDSLDDTRISSLSDGDYVFLKKE